jgi:hypothetical protein
MWKLWQKAKTYNRLPSEVFGEEDSIAAWLLDNAVTWFGITIENALSERVKVGYGAQVEYKPKYTLALLLDKNFRLPRPVEELSTSKAGLNPWAPLLAWAGKRGSGIKRYEYRKTVD